MTVHIDGHGATAERIRRLGGYSQYAGAYRSGDTIIRWGCNHNRFGLPSADGIRVLNRKIIFDKFEQGVLFTDAGVSIPKMFHTQLQWERNSRPHLLKKPRIGERGVGIQRVTAPTWSDPNVIYQLYIEKEREFRAMMVGNLIAFFMEKHRPANGDIRWNECRGSEWTGVPDDRQLRVSVKQLGEAGLRALTYDFGAVDIIMDGAGKLYILEINSRPEFEDGNAQRFVNAVRAVYLERS